ncbi:hypothetical protein AWENTII_011548 [Aspergillus wentii]
MPDPQTFKMDPALEPLCTMIKGEVKKNHDQCMEIQQRLATFASSPDKNDQSKWMKQITDEMATVKRQQREIFEGLRETGYERVRDLPESMQEDAAFMYSRAAAPVEDFLEKACSVFSSRIMGEWIRDAEVAEAGIAKWGRDLGGLAGGGFGED